MVNYKMQMTRPDGVIEIHMGDMKTQINNANNFIKSHYKLNLNIKKRTLSDLTTRPQLVSKIIRSIITTSIERTTPIGITAITKQKRKKRNVTTLPIPQSEENCDIGTSSSDSNTEQHQDGNYVSQ